MPLWGSERFSNMYNYSRGDPGSHHYADSVAAPISEGDRDKRKGTKQWQWERFCLTAVSLESWTSFLPSHRWARRRRGGSCLKGWRTGCCCPPGQQGVSWGGPPAPGRKAGHQACFWPTVREAEIRTRKSPISENTEGLIVALQNLCLWNYTVLNSKSPIIKKIE